MMRLVDIDESNFIEAAKLSTNKDGHCGMSESFVMSNLFSLAQLQFLPGFKAQALYHDTQMVGFVMYGLEDQTPWIYRFMIDYHAQSKGYGKRGLQLILETMETVYQSDKIMISFDADNIKARSLYERLGFKDTGIIENDELIYERCTNVV